MKPRFNFLLTSLAVVVMPQAAEAASGTWKTVATDGLWHTATNWSGGAAPNAAADIATFNSGSNFTTVSIAATTTTVDRINFSGAGVAAFTFTGTGTTNMVMSTNGGGVFIDSSVTTNQDLSGIPIIRPGMDDTINFSNQGSGLLKLGTFQAQNTTGSLSTLNFTPGANGDIEIASGKKIDNAGTGGVKKIAIVLDDVGTLRIAAIGSYDGSNAEGNSVSIRQGTLEAAIIKNSGTQSSLGAGGRIQFGKAATTNTATLDYYGATDTTNRDFQIVGSNTAVIKISGGAANNLSITSAITESASGGKLTKDGVGILTLTNTSSYTGATTVNNGKLIVNGNISTSSLTTVQDTATLGGTGTVGAVTVESGGIFAPGNSAGTMTFTGDLTLDLDSISDFEINAFTSGNHDLALAQVAGTQSVNFNSGILNLLFQSGFNTSGSVKIFDFDSYAGDFGTVNVIGLADGYTANFNPSNGIVTVVPEPDTAMLVGGLGMLALLRRRRA